RRHQAELVVLALESRLRPMLPDVPDVTDELHHLPETRPRRGPRRGVPPLVVPLHLRAEPESEAAARGGLQVPRDLRVDERTPGEGDGDVRPERDALGRGRGDGDRQVRIVAGLRGPEAVVAELLGMASEPWYLAQVGDQDGGVDLHARSLLDGQARGQGDAMVRPGFTSSARRRPGSPSPRSAAATPPRRSRPLPRARARCAAPRAPGRRAPLDPQARPRAPRPPRSSPAARPADRRVSSARSATAAPP